MIRLALLGSLVAVWACSDNNNKTPDAFVKKDAQVTTVVPVSPCPATPAATITTVDTAFVFTPNTATINVGQVVQFTMSSTHNVVPDLTGSDPGLMVNSNATKCLMFTQPGTFGFHCGPHSFAGHITVQ